MPEIDSRLLLDLLLGFIVLLFVPFGIRRGVAKEAMVSAGVLLGALLADAWATAGGAWLAGAIGLDSALASFAVALGALLGGTFAIGYGAGAAVGDLRPGIASRLAGGLLAALNGVLFLAYLLRTIDRWLQPGDALRDGIAPGILIDRFDELLLAGGALVLLLIVIGWIVRAVRGPRYAPVVEPAVSQRSRPLRVDPSGDVGKFEPVPSSPPGRGGSTMAETAPLAAEPGPGGNPWQRPTGSSPAPNGHTRLPGPVSNQAAGGEWLHRSGEAAVVGTAGQTGWVPPTGDGGRRFGTTPGGEGVGEERRRCPTCGAVAGPTDLYCQQCGKTL